MMTFPDKAVIAFLAAASAAAMIFQGFFLAGEKGEKVLISVDGEEYAVYNFSDIDEEITLEIETEFGSNTVKIDEKSVWIAEASCPDKLDVKSGRISKANQMIVCLPNRLMIEIKGGERKADRVTY